MGGVQNVWGVGKVAENTPSPKISEALQKSFWPAQLWNFVQEGNDPRRVENVPDEGGSKPLFFGRGVLRERFLSLLSPPPPWRSLILSQFYRIFAQGFPCLGGQEKLRQIKPKKVRFANFRGVRNWFRKPLLLLNAIQNPPKRGFRNQFRTPSRKVLEPHFLWFGLLAPLLVWGGGGCPHEEVNLVFFRDLHPRVFLDPLRGKTTCNANAHVLRKGIAVLL